MLQYIQGESSLFIMLVEGPCLLCPTSGTLFLMVHIVRSKNTPERDTYKYPSLLRVGRGELVFVPRGSGSVGTSEKGSVDTTGKKGSNPRGSGCELE